MTIEFLALVVGALNGFILLVKPIGRFHARLDVLEARLMRIEATLDRVIDRD